MSGRPGLHAFTDVGMDVVISRANVDWLVAEAAAHAPEECCGLIVGTADDGQLAVRQLIATSNVAGDRVTQFEIDPAALLAAHRQSRADGQALIGWYHSHPNGLAAPSRADAARITEPGKLWLIIAGGQVQAFISATQSFHAATILAS